MLEKIQKAREKASEEEGSLTHPLHMDIYGIHHIY